MAAESDGAASPNPSQVTPYLSANSWRPCQKISAVQFVRRAVRFVAGDAVAAPLDRLEPGHVRHMVGVRRLHRFEQRVRDRCILGAVLGAVDAEAVGLEPGRRSAIDDIADADGIDAEVIPVDQVMQVVETEAPRRVLGFVRGARRQPALAIDGEDLDALRARPLEGHRLADRCGRAVPGRAGVEFEEEGLTLHLGVAREAAVPPEAEQIIPHQLPPLGLRHRIFFVAGAFVLGAQCGVVRRERRVDERDGMPRDEHVAVAEPFFRMANVPAHKAAERQGDEHVPLRARPAGVPALSVVLEDIDEVVDAIADLFPIRKLLFEFGLPDT